MTCGIEILYHLPRVLIQTQNLIENPHTKIHKKSTQFFTQKIYKGKEFNFFMDKLIWNLFFMFGGVAVMMFGMKVMGDSLEKCAGGKMKTLLGKATTNRFAGVGVGLAVTAVIQSSTATTVMLVGFVNIGLMTLAQATNVIMGANIGTTVTAHIASLAGIGSIDIGAICAFIGFVGIFISMLVKNEKIATIGSILGGLGLIFVGLEVISHYAGNVMLDGDKNPYPFVQSFFGNDHFPLLLVLIGIVLTAIVHSSSTITSLMVVLCGIVTSTGAPLLSLQNALFLTLGSNIGTCITSIIVGISANTNAKRTGLVHMLFNTIGCVIFLAPLWIWSNEIVAFLSSISAGAGQALAIFHTVFNVVTTALLLPFTKYIVKLACLIIPDKKKKDSAEDKKTLHFVDKKILEIPHVAFENSKKEIIRMSSLAKENLNLSVNMLLDSDADNEKLMRENEEAINFINRGMVAFLSQLIGKNLPEADDKAVGSYFHVVSDIERVGDYAENILEYSLRLRKDGMEFSEHAKQELSAVLDKLNELFDLSLDAFEKVSYQNFDRINEIEESIDVDSELLEEKHIDRVKRNACTAELGSIYLQTVSNLERIGDHINNIAKSIRNYKAK